jgi:hypothetical protein
MIRPSDNLGAGMLDFSTGNLTGCTGVDDPEISQARESGVPECHR